MLVMNIIVFIQVRGPSNDGHYFLSQKQAVLSPYKTLFSIQEGFRTRSGKKF